MAQRDVEAESLVRGHQRCYQDHVTQDQGQDQDHKCQDQDQDQVSQDQD